MCIELDRLYEILREDPKLDKWTIREMGCREHLWFSLGDIGHVRRQLQLEKWKETARAKREREKEAAEEETCCPSCCRCSCHRVGRMAERTTPGVMIDPAAAFPVTFLGFPG